MLLFCPCEDCYINDLRSILKQDEIMARWVCSFCGFWRLSVPDLAAQINTVLAEMGRPLSCDQHHHGCQCHEEFHHVSSKWIYVTLQAATPTSSWFLRPSEISSAWGTLLDLTLTITDYPVLESSGSKAWSLQSWWPGCRESMSPTALLVARDGIRRRMMKTYLKNIDKWCNMMKHYETNKTKTEDDWKLKGIVCVCEFCHASRRACHCSIANAWGWCARERLRATPTLAVPSTCCFEPCFQ